jgi:LmbE family N-acetylglucosaminyl deacetylase
MMATTALAGAAQAVTNAPALRLVIVGAHPDDPESSCGGTMARCADLGFDVVALYLTRGEAGIAHKTEAEAAAIRTQEAEKACAILKARPRFAGQVDGNTEINNTRYRDFHAALMVEKPNIVIAPWPIDSHRDHRAASLLTYDAWERERRSFELFYSEVNLGDQSKNFHPTDYVNISTVVERKRDACYAHASQDPPGFYERYHEPMQRLRGLEYACAAAEAFVRLAQNPGRWNLPRS